ncbi:MAP9 protein, partial [Nothocercus nigrocapillus]|nr:MAP9 protein [Nothocercus nigrocapillus]
ELQDAITARVARQQAAEYSDDFESDDDGMLNSTAEELPESNSDIESTKKSIAFESSLSDEDTSQKAVLLENEAADDFPFREEKAQQTIILENKNMQDDKKDSEEECLESQNGDDRKNDEDCSPAEEVPQDNSESGHCNDLCTPELQREVLMLNQEENKPVPKQRMCKMRNASAPDGCYKPSPQLRSLLRKSISMKRTYAIDNALNRLEEKIIARNVVSSVSPPFSLTSWKATAEKKMFSESRDPEGELLEGASPPLSIHFTSQNKRSGDSNSLMCGDAPSIKAKSPSVIDKMKTPGYEKTRKSENLTDDSSERHMQIVEGQIVTDTIQEVSMDDKSEHVEVKNTKCTKKVLKQKDHLSWYLYRSLYFSLLKKNVTALPSSRAVSPQYLGTLKVLEGKGSQKCSAEVGKADSIRAAVYQKEAAKREEAIASFEAWKAMKERAAKKLSEKRKLEELNKKRVAEQDEEKREAAQKAFEKWKERKVEYLRELNRKEKQSERIRKKKEEELVAEKKRDSRSAVEKWNEKKEECIKQKKIEKLLERRKQEVQQMKKEEKDKRAMEEYERWLEKKERKEQLEKKQRKLKAVLADKAPSPWSPPGKVTYSANY